MSNLAPPDSNTPARLSLVRLKRQMLMVVGVQIAASVLLWRALAHVYLPPEQVLWAAVTTVALIHIWRLSWRYLPLHRTQQGDELLPALGPGNWLSLLRAWCLAALAGFILLPWPEGLWAWLPAALYTVAALLDYFDGYAARRSGTTSAFGAFLDMELDGLGMLIVVSVAIHLGHLPLGFIVIGLARYVFSMALTRREQRGLPTRPLSPSDLRRILAGLQMGFLSVVLWPIVNQQIMTLTGILFAVPFLTVFLRDWLVVSERLDISAAEYQRWEQRLEIIFGGWLPLLARIAGGFGLIVLISQALTQYDAVVAALAAFGLPAATWVTALFLLLEVVGLPLLVFGVAGRWVALGLLLPVGISALTTLVDPFYLLTVMSCVYVLIFGSGYRALWQPEEAWFRRRAGTS